MKENLLKVNFKIKIIFSNKNDIDINLNIRLKAVCSSDSSLGMKEHISLPSITASFEAVLGLTRGNYLCKVT